LRSQKIQIRKLMQAKSETIFARRVIWVLPATLAEEKLEVSEESPDPPVRVVVAGSFLDDALLLLGRAHQERVLTHLQKVKLEKTTMISSPGTNVIKLFYRNLRII
jgi:hypothetical protein